jgi:hypothetical protein
MRRRLLIAVVGLLAIGAAGSARSATLDFTGTLELQPFSRAFPAPVIPGGGSAQVSDDGSFHLLSFALAGATFGPMTTSLPLTSNSEFNSVVFTAIQNLSGSFSAISGGPPGGGSMGLQGVAKICGIYPAGPCSNFSISVPLTPTTGGGVGFGIGGTQTWLPPFNAPALTMQHSPWTIGQPVMTIHTPNTTISVPTLPGGFAHGPASLTSSTARPGGALNLVTVSKVFTTLGFAPEVPVAGVLNLHFVPEPGTLLLLGSGVTVLALLGWRRRSR